MSMLYCVQHF